MGFTKMKLPNAENAFIDVRKLRDYSLSDSHPVGKHKARVFRSALGLTDADWDRLRVMILEAAVASEAELGRTDEYGTRYQLDFSASTNEGTATIRTAWIVRNETEPPRLLSCYVLARG